MICKNCGSNVEEYAVFCTNCGAMVESGETPQAQADDKTVVLWDEEVQQEQNVQKTAVCPNCGKENAEGIMFCVHCGAFMTEQGKQQETSQNMAQGTGFQSTDFQSNTTMPTQGNSDKKQRGKSKLPWILSGAFLGIAAVAAVVFLVFSNIDMQGNKSVEKLSADLIYLKEDDEIYLVPQGKTKSQYISDEMLPIQTLDDGKYVLCLEYDKGGDGNTLFYNKVGSDEEGIELAEDIELRFFEVTPKGNVLYIKDEDKLCFHNLKEEIKLSSNCDDCWLSEDKNYIIWSEKDDYYVQDVECKKEAIEIKDCERWIGATDDLSYIYYYDDGDLKCYRDLKEEIEIDSGLEGFDSTVLFSDVSHTLYYYEKERKDYTYYDLIEDDVANRAEENYPNYEQYKSMCEEEGMDLYDITLYSYSPETGESEKVKEFTGWLDSIASYSYSYDGQDEFLLFYDVKVDQYIKMSEILKYAEEETGLLIKEAIMEEADYYLVCQNELKQLKGMETFAAHYSNAIVNHKTKEIYFAAEYRVYDEESEDTDYVFDMYACSYEEEKPSCQLIVNDLVEWKENMDGVYFLCRARNEDEGVLYLNGKEIADDVISVRDEFIVRDDISGSCYETNDGFYLYLNGESIELGEDLGNDIFKIGETLFYWTDYDYDDEEGTFMQYKNGKVTEIAEGASRISVLGEGRVAYFQDYSSKKGEGTLFIFDGKKSIEIDSCVEYFGLISYSQSHDWSSGWSYNGIKGISAIYGLYDREIHELSLGY